MIKSFIFITFISVFLSVESVTDVPDSSPPSRYTVTHEATFEIVVKENIHTDEVLSKGKIVIGLFGEIVPMTVLNFVSITNGIVRGNVKQKRFSIKEDKKNIILFSRQILHTMTCHFIVLSKIFVFKQAIFSIEMEQEVRYCDLRNK